MLSGFRRRLILQAAITALLGVSGPVSGWTIPTLIVAAAAVFVALAMRPEPVWRWYVVGFVGFAVAYGLVALVSGHYVPGTIVAGITLYALLDGTGASAFAGTPTWAPPVPGTAPAYGAPAIPTYPPPTAPPPAALAPVPVVEVPAQPVAAAPLPEVPAQPVAPPLPEAPAPAVPAQPLGRPAAMTILPGK
jgi:hypothetical protein